MTPETEITKEQSFLNFTTKSMLNRQDVVATLDTWLRQIKDDALRIRLCPASAKILRQIVYDMRVYVIRTGIPDIYPAVTGTRYRYTLDLYHDGLQLGIERFHEDALFDETGMEIPMILDPGEEDNLPETEELPVYSLAYKSPAPIWTVEQYAKANDVKPATVRKWLSRGRILGIKAGSATRVSAIQYTPDAYKNADGTTYRFKSIDTAPEALASIDPIFTGRIMDLLVHPARDIDQTRAEGYAVLCIHETDGPDGRSFKAESTMLDRAGRDALLDALYSTDGVRATADMYYQSPFRNGSDDRPTHHAVLLPPERNSGPNARALSSHAETKGLTPAREPDDKSPADRTVELFLSVTDKDGKSAEFGGRICLYGLTAEEKLLHAIFGPPETIGEITTALDAANADSGNYPWNQCVLLLDELETGMSTKSLRTVLHRLPYLVQCNTCIQPGLLLARRGSHDKDFTDAGFRPAGKYLYAYVGTGRTFRGFQKPVAEKTKV